MFSFTQCIGRKTFCQIFAYEKKFLNRISIQVCLFMSAVYQYCDCFLRSGCVGGARAPPRIWGFSKGVKPDFCLSEFSYYSKHLCMALVSTTPITAMGCRQCLPLSAVQLKGKHCRKPNCRNGVLIESIRLYHGLQMPCEEIAFTARPQIKSQSQVRPKHILSAASAHIFSFFDICFHWVSVVRSR